MILRCRDEDDKFESYKCKDEKIDDETPFRRLEQTFIYPTMTTLPYRLYPGCENLSKVAGEDATPFVCERLHYCDFAP